MINITTHYIIKKNNEFFAKDNYSGGYPCLLPESDSAYKYKTMQDYLKDAEYRKMFPAFFHNARLIKVTVTREYKEVTNVK